jgi:hypothetical protein
MSTPNVQNTRHQFLSWLVFGVVIAFLYGCAFRPKNNPPVPPPVSSTKLDRSFIRPAEASARAKEDDFRLNPPLVEEMFVKRLTKPSPEGDALLVVKFAPDRRLKRQVTIRPDEKPIVLRDDGLEGDEKAEDGSFSAIFPTLSAARKGVMRQLTS